MTATETDALVYTLRPDRTACWLPAGLCERLGIKRGQLLTPDQFSHPKIQQVLDMRKAKKSKSEKEQ